MAAKFAGGNGAIALLCNTLPTGAILTVLILVLGPVSGAHLNPAASVALAARGDIAWGEAAAYDRSLEGENRRRRLCEDLFARTKMFLTAVV